MRTKAFFIVLPLLALVSCQREEMEYIQDSPAKGQEIRITAGIGDADPSTRTSISSNGKVLWSPGEAINIFYGPSGESSGSKFVSQNTEAASTAVFTGTITAFTGVSEGGEPLSFWGIYPYSESNRCNGSSVVVELPVIQNAVEENFEDNTVPMVAQAPGLALPFYNVCSMIRFSLVNSDITKVTVRGNNGETVAGRVSVSMGSDGKPVWSDTEGEGSKSITLNGPSGGAFEAGKFYYIAILPGEFPNGYTMEFFTSDGRHGERVRGSSITFNRTESTKQSSRDQGVTFTSLYVDMGNGMKWATMNVGATTPEEFGDYFAWGETTPKSEYSDGNYAFGTETALTRYVSNSEYGTVDGRTTLLPEDDAATANWGGDWRMPTASEWSWLMNNCTSESTTENGVSGYRFTSKIDGYTDKSIFIPSAGCYFDSSPVNEGRAFYWTSTVQLTGRSNYANYGRESGSSTGHRYSGRPVRAVYMPRVSMTSFSIRESSITIGVELKVLLNTTYFPTDATVIGAIWTSSDESVAKVSGWGEVTGVGEGTATITATSLDGGFKSSCTVTVIPTFVDMGGGMEWATFNVGADGPADYGPYFAWGETTTKTSFTWSNYRLGRENDPWYYNSSDGLIVLQQGHDAASSKWKGLWHIPTEEEWQWLADNCTWTWTEDYDGTGINGDVVTSNLTGNSIFLPAGGYLHGSEDYMFVNKRVQYWSSSVYDDNPNGARTVSFYGDTKRINWDYRYMGRNIRAVRRKWVDMGDGLKWATTNLGGFNPEDYGDYFAWGETKTKNDYSWDTYKWMEEGQADEYHITKYTVADGQTDGIWYDTDGNFIGDNNSVLQRFTLTWITSDDAAEANWGATWRMPTHEEWTWLRKNCTWTWTDDYNGTGVAGRIVTATNGNSLFLPAAGFKDGSSLEDVDYWGMYWSSSIYSTGSASAFGVGFTSNFTSAMYAIRFYGRAVRPVSN